MLVNIIKLKYSPKIILLYTAVGQIIFIFFASALHNWYLFFISLVAICFVFGQIPITDTILSRYVPDAWRARVFSIKFMLNLSIGASVLPVCGIILQTGYSMNSLFTLMSAIATLIVVSAVILPKQQTDQRIDYAPEK